MYILKSILFITINIFTIIFANNSSFLLSGYVDYSYISRLSDGSVIDIPYRMASLNFEKRGKNIFLNGSFALEYHLRNDSYFLGSSNPQDFILDLRELYATYTSNNFEFRIGKQIQSWGNVDENSPIDNVSPLDYYYMFFGGTERKMASLSVAMDYYVGNLKLSAVFSPLHSTNRLPLGDDDFPVELPVYPEPSEIFSISSTPYETGIRGVWSTNIFDISASYFSGYDRIFNFKGANVYFNRLSNAPAPNAELVFGYRKSNVFGTGFTFLNDYFNIRFDIGIFNTVDMDESIERPYTAGGPLAAYFDSVAFSYPIQEKATYRQSTIQFETELPFNINLIAQYFQHDLSEYSAVDTLPDVTIDIPGFEYDPEQMSPQDFFIPGMGVPIAILTSKATFITLDKNLFDDQFNISFTSMIDIAKYQDITGSAGNLLEYKLTYSIEQDFKCILALTQVNGNDNHPDQNDYPFNRMEDFSHGRIEIKYFF